MLGGSFHAVRIDRDVAIVHDLEIGKRVEHRLGVRLWRAPDREDLAHTHGGRSEVCAGARPSACQAVSNDRDIHLASDEILGRDGDREFKESRDAVVGEADVVTLDIDRPALRASAEKSRF